MDHSTFDANETMRFISNYRSSGDGIPGMSPIQYSGTVPRSHVPLPHSSSLAQATTPPTRSKGSYSSASTAYTESTGASGAYAWSSYAPSVMPTEAASSQTSVASTRPAGQEPAGANQDGPEPGTYLPCEFVGWSSCDRRFDVADFNFWVDHIIREHLYDNLPAKALCWFCDDYVFDSNTSELRGDRRTNFEHRMWHIRDHIVDEQKTEHDIRVDYHYLHHLHRHRLISEESFFRTKRGWRDPRTLR